MYHSFTQYSQAQFGPYCILSNFFLIGQLEQLRQQLKLRLKLKLSRTARAKYFATQLVAAQIVYNLPRLIIIYSDRTLLAPQLGQVDAELTRCAQSWTGRKFGHIDDFDSKLLVRLPVYATSHNGEGSSAG